MSLSQDAASLQWSGINSFVQNFFAAQSPLPSAAKSTRTKSRTAEKGPGEMRLLPCMKEHQVNPVALTERHPANSGALSNLHHRN